MKKKFLTVVLCLSLAAAFSACKSSDSSSDSASSGDLAIEATETAESSTESEDNTAGTTESTYEASVETESSADEPESATDSAESEGIALSDGVLETPKYTMNVGSSWEIYSKSDSEVSLNSTTEDSTAKMSVTYSDSYTDVNASSLLEEMSSRYSSANGYTIEEKEQITVDGKEAVSLVVSAKQTESGEAIWFKQVALLSDSSVIFIKFTCPESGFETSVAEFDEVVQTFSEK